MSLVATVPPVVFAPALPILKFDFTIESAATEPKNVTVLVASVVFTPAELVTIIFTVPTPVVPSEQTAIFASEVVVVGAIERPTVAE